MIYIQLIYIYIYYIHILKKKNYFKFLHFTFIFFFSLLSFTLFHVNSTFYQIFGFMFIVLISWTDLKFNKTYFKKKIIKHI